MPDNQHRGVWSEIKAPITGHRKLYSKPSTFAGEQFYGFGSAALNV
ncbi:MAG: hypothetical protein IKB11_05300 [Bacteroidaceae bacterium]|nr:hypothetical protein [Bacteroidaceae bacterium]